MASIDELEARGESARRANANETPDAFEACMKTSYDAHWFCAAIVLSDGSLSPAVIFKPSSSIRIGRAPTNDFVVPDFALESLLVLSSGTTLHLLPESTVRMAGPGSANFSVADHESSGGSVRVTAERVNFAVREGLSLFVRYQPTREDLERFIAQIEES